MSASPDPALPPNAAGISAAAERARERLHDEIERVRVGVEEMLAEQGDGGGDDDLRRELDELRAETRRYVKRRVRKAEKRIEKSVRKSVEERTRQLEQRLDQVEQDRKYAEWRIHTSTEAMLDGLLRDIRTIADRITQLNPRR